MCDRALHLEKQQENSLVWTAQSKMLVDSMLDDVYAVLQPTKEQQEARRYVIHFVDNFVKSRIQGEFLFYLCSISLHLGFRWDDFLLCLEKNGNWYGQRMRRGRKSYPCCHGPGPPICWECLVCFFGEEYVLLMLSLLCRKPHYSVWVICNGLVYGLKWLGPFS